MRAVLSAIAVSLALLLAWLGNSRAALDRAPVRAPSLEVLVFEHTDCVYCQILRRDVLPKYRHSVRSDVAPLRFVDVQASDIGGLGLNARIDTVPTVIVMRDGREVGRIVGYWGPTNFFSLLTHILGRAE
jgi:thioredoxin-related protein